MSTNYLTPEGFNRLRGELLTLLNEERPKVVLAVNVAAAMGDRSENAEYIYGKRRLREIDRRIGFLQKRLDNIEVVDVLKSDATQVSFGYWVEVRDEKGECAVYRIIGEDEIDAAHGCITFSSPIGRALLGKKIGDYVKVQRPKGEVELEIVSIKNFAPKNAP